jgi:ABC-type spermidine/putrescine transport system permease subunit II
MFESRRYPLVLGLVTVVVLLFLYVPLIPPILFSLQPVQASTGLPAGAASLGSGFSNGLSLDSYFALLDNPSLPDALQTTLLSAALTAVVATVLGLLGALAIRELRLSRLILMMLLAPLFVPGVTMGLSDAFFFHALNLEPSLLTIVLVQVLWCLPFSTVIIVTAMSAFDQSFVEAAYVLGAGRLRAFFDIEFPAISTGVIGSALFAAILSINETVRTQLVQGAYNNIQTYIWAIYLQVGLSPDIYALMSLLVIASVMIFVVVLALGVRSSRSQTAEFG